MHFAAKMFSVSRIFYNLVHGKTFCSSLEKVELLAQFCPHFCNTFSVS